MTPWPTVKALFLILSVGAAFAQPFVYYRGIANAASFAPSGLKPTSMTDP